MSQCENDAFQRLSAPFADRWVVVRGGGDVASGPIQRLRWAGFSILVTELAQPLVVRRWVSFSNAVYEGAWQVEGTPAKRVASLREARAYLAANAEGVPVLVDPQAAVLRELRPTVLVDGRMAKAPLDTTPDQADIVIGLGPGFEAGRHVHAVVETKGGSLCGRVYYDGAALADTGLPCESSGFREERVLRAPLAGVFHERRALGDHVLAGETVGVIEAGGRTVPVKAEIDGLLRGLLHSGLRVAAGVKLGDIDHRGASSDCCRVSEKADSVAAGVLQAILQLGLAQGLWAARP